MENINDCATAYFTIYDEIMTPESGNYRKMLSIPVTKRQKYKGRFLFKIKGYRIKCNKIPNHTPEQESPGNEPKCIL